MKKVWKLLVFLAASCSSGGMHAIPVLGQSQSTSVHAVTRPVVETTRKKKAVRKHRMTAAERRAAAERAWAKKAKLMLKKYGPCGNPRDVAERFIRNADGSCNWDIQRITPDILVIHETADTAPMGLVYLSEVQKHNIYNPGFRQSSGHFAVIDGERREVFWAYHWMIRQNCEVVSLLDESQIAWNSANWDVNKRSNAIVLEGVYNKAGTSPSECMLAALDSLVFAQELKYGGMAVLAHQEVKGIERTPCPGQWFYAWREGVEERYAQFLARKKAEALVRAFVAARF